MKKVMILGSGGREHALAAKLSQSPQVAEVIAVPGNPGIAREPGCRCLSLPDYAAMVAYARQEEIDLTLVGPEGPLVDGVADLFRANNLTIFGPGRAEAELEGSKKFAKEFMQEFGVATAGYVTFSEPGEALEYVRSSRYPLVVKASGLCAGKGVTICATKEEAVQALSEFMTDRVFAEAGSTVVIEECLEGPEVSVLAIYDGRAIFPLVSAMDHKRIGEGDTGPNTGGMGTIAPAPAFSDSVRADFIKNILKPTERGLAARGFRDPACIFFGLMVTPSGVRLLEYNMRFGDPETQSILTLLESDLYEIFAHACAGTLSADDLIFAEETALCVIGAAKGYPGPYEKNIEVNFPPAQGIKVFLAGVREANGRLLSSGGRIFGVTARGALPEVRERCLNYLEQFKDQPIVWRRDIGLGAMASIKTK